MIRCTTETITEEIAHAIIAALGSSENPVEQMHEMVKLLDQAGYKIVRKEPTSRIGPIIEHRINYGRLGREQNFKADCSCGWSFEGTKDEVVAARNDHAWLNVLTDLAENHGITIFMAHPNAKSRYDG